MSKPDISIDPDMEKLLAEYKEQGFKCELCTHVPSEGWTSPEKGHGADEIYILLEGDMEVDLYGKTHSPTLGEAFRIPAHEPHALRITGSQPSTFYWIYAW